MIRTLAICLLAAAVGCAHQPVDLGSAERELAAAAQQASAPPPVPASVNDALARNHGGGLRASTERFDVAVRELPARDFFMGLMRDTRTNVVVHPEVEGEITLNLQAVTAEQVLSVVRDIYGYEYKRDGGIYTIYPRKLRTEVFSINYPDLKRVGVSDTAVSIGDITSGEQSEKSDSSANILGFASGDEKSSQGSSISPGSRVQTLTHTDFWRTISMSVGGMIDADQPGRRVLVNPQAGLVVVTAMPVELNVVRDFLSRSELIAKRQVVLEAKIIEVRLSDDFNAGINWEAITGQLAYNNLKTFQSSQTGSGLNALIGVARDRTETFSTLLGVESIGDLLSLLRTQGDVKVLSSPRVSTVNNQKAVIRVGTDEFFVTGIKNNTTASAGATTQSPEVQLASFFSGISLDITPQIGADGEVILHIHPIVSEVTDQRKEINVGDSRFSLPLALRDVREADSIVRARSGEVVVLGGLMQELESSETRSRPGMGDVPIVGSLFRNNRRVTSKSELVILLRPVVVGEGGWGSEIERLRDFDLSLEARP